MAMVEVALRCVMVAVGSCCTEMHHFIRLVLKITINLKLQMMESDRIVCGNADQVIGRIKTL